MPPLSPPSRSVSVVLPSRRGTVAAETDVLVVGGGPAGIGAALGAAEAGADVVLVERYGFLGGNATAALVMPLTSYHTEGKRRSNGGTALLMPPDHGAGEPVIAGVLERFVGRLVAAGGARSPDSRNGYTVPFDPELFKTTAFDLLDEAGVRFLLHAFASSVIGEGRIEGVVFETKSGPTVVRARAVVDATGDGDIAAFAGAPFEIGRGIDELVQPITLMGRISGFEAAAFSRFIDGRPDRWRGVHGLWELVREAKARGELDLPRDDFLMFSSLYPTEVTLNTTRVTGVRGIDVWDLTRAEWESRRQLRAAVAFLKKKVPGFAESYLVQSGVQIGVRETRRIKGEYTLTADDVLSARKFDDVIARCAYPIDLHNPEGAGTVLKRVPPGDAYDIPLRCLIPKGAKNLVVAGRCLSGTHEAHSSYRVMPAAMATGQAAGATAALICRTGQPPHRIDVSDVQRELRRQGADLRGIGRSAPVS